MMSEREAQQRMPNGQNQWENGLENWGGIDVEQPIRNERARRAPKMSNAGNTYWTPTPGKLPEKWTNLHKLWKKYVVELPVIEASKRTLSVSREMKPGMATTQRGTPKWRKIAEGVCREFDDDVEANCWEWKLRGCTSSSSSLPSSASCSSFCRLKNWERLKFYKEFNLVFLKGFNLISEKN